MKHIEKAFLLGGFAMTMVLLIVFLSKKLTDNHFSFVNVRVAGGDMNFN